MYKVVFGQQPQLSVRGYWRSKGVGDIYSTSYRTSPCYNLSPHFLTHTPIPTPTPLPTLHQHHTLTTTSTAVQLTRGGCGGGAIIRSITTSTTRTSTGTGRSTSKPKMKRKSKEDEEDEEDENEEEDLGEFQRLVHEAVLKAESETISEVPKSDKLTRITKVVDDGKPLPNTFEEIGVQLPDVIMNNLKTVGITKPTHIQSKAIPAILNGEDVLIQSHTGTGKTLAYVLPLLQFFLQTRDLKNGQPVAVIAAPTYELALQIQSVFEVLLVGMYPEDHELAASFVHPVFDDDLSYQLRTIQQKKPVVLLGTPRTLLGIIVGDESSRIIASNISNSIKMLVLDEPDQIIAPLSKYAPLKKVLNRQRHPKPGWTMAKHIMEHSPGVQLVCASATINRTLRGSLFSAGFSHMTLTTIGDPFRIPYHIKHRFVEYSDPLQRIQTLKTVYAECIFPKSALVFCASSESLETLAKELQASGIKAVVLHKQMETRNLKAREAFLNSFRIGEIQLVLVSELSGRGLDFPSLEHVIIFATPTDANSYIHMAGRTGRALMKKGIVTTILPKEQVPVLAKISNYIQVHFKKLEVN